MVGERSEECRSALLMAGERTGSSGEAMATDGATEAAYWDSEAMEPTRTRLAGGSLPLRLSVLLPLRLVLVGVAFGLPRAGPWESESLTRFEASLSAPEC